MAYTITKLSDGDLSIGNLRGELVNLQPALSDYPTGGYLIEGIGGTTESVGNVGMDKVLTVIPAGGQQQYAPVWQPATSKLEMWASGSQVAASTDLSALTFELLLIGY
jgi:hypothetical protein